MVNKSLFTSDWKTVLLTPQVALVSLKWVISVCWQGKASSHWGGLPCWVLKALKASENCGLTVRHAEHHAWTPLFCTGIIQLPFWLQLYGTLQQRCWLHFRLHSSVDRPFRVFFIKSNSLKQWKLWELTAACENTIYSSPVFSLLRQYKFLLYGCLLWARPSLDTARTQKDPWKHWSKTNL